MATEAHEWDPGPEACEGCGSPKKYVKLRPIRMVDMDGERSELCRRCFAEACEAGRVEPARAEQGWRPC